MSASIDVSFILVSRPQSFQAFRTPFSFALPRQLDPAAHPPAFRIAAIRLA